MIAVDTSVLVYAHRREASEYPIASELVRGLAQSPEPWAIPWPCVYEFFSVVTSARVWKDAATTPDKAWAQLTAWFDSPSLRLIGETESFPDVLAAYARRGRVRGAVIHDARVAAICTAHGVEALLTRDRDFSIFPELKTQNPFS